MGASEFAPVSEGFDSEISCASGFRVSSRAGSLCADLDHDGRLDVVTNDEAAVHVLMNRGGESRRGVRGAVQPDAQAAIAPRASRLAATVNPVSRRGEIALNLELAQNEPAVDLAVYDVSGRRVGVLARGALAAGVHHIPWTGATAWGAVPPPGGSLLRARKVGRRRRHRSAAPVALNAPPLAVKQARWQPAPAPASFNGNDRPLPRSPARHAPWRGRPRRAGAEASRRRSVRLWAPRVAAALPGLPLPRRGGHRARGLRVHEHPRRPARDPGASPPPRCSRASAPPRPTPRPPTRRCRRSWATSSGG